MQTIDILKVLTVCLLYTSLCLDIIIKETVQRGAVCLIAIDTILYISPNFFHHISECTTLSLSFWNFVRAYQLPTVDATLLTLHIEVSVLVLAVTPL